MEKQSLPLPLYPHISNMEILWQHSTSFNRIIMPSVIRERRLVLPKKFVEEYGNELSSTIKLSIPLGGAWYVELIQPCGGELLCLGVGWEEFMQHYSIRFGYFLLFKYKGNSEFDVHIFDLTATEIQYPLVSNSDISNHTKKHGVHETRSRGVAIKEEEEEEEDGTESSTPRKKRKEIPTEQLASASSDGTHVRLCSNGNSEKKTVVVVDQVEEMPLVAAEAMYKPENPFFIVKLKDYHVKARIFHLPRQFCREHMDGFPVFIQILDSDNMTWLVRCIKNDDRVSLCKGWPQFVEEKRFKTGDVCIFELIASDAMKVSVFLAK